MKTTALLLIDYQNDYFPSFEDAKYPIVETEVAASKGAQLLSLFRKKKLPIIHVKHESNTRDAPFFLANTQGAQIHSSVTPKEEETIIVKSEINSFKETKLHGILQHKSVDKLIIVGAMSHMCIDAAARAATDLNYECCIAHDACTTLALEFNGVRVPAAHVHAAFMSSLQFGYCKVDSTDNLLKKYSNLTSM